MLEAINSDVPRAVVLLSGGLDSAVVATMARRDGREIHALTFLYGQRHSVELEAAKRVASAVGVSQHIEIQLDARAFASSSLTGEGEVPKGRSDDEIAGGIPSTYVPARNLVFLSMAGAYAQSVGAGEIHIGVNAVDYSGYPDCRGEYLSAFEAMANLATRGAVEGSLPVKIHSPLVDKTKAEIIALGTGLGVDYGLTRSCYDPDPEGQACGACDSCVLRLRGFAEAGISDPAPYQLRTEDHGLRG